MLESTIVTLKIRGYLVETVRSCEKILLYANGLFVCELRPASNPREYITQADIILP